MKADDLPPLALNSIHSSSSQLNAGLKAAIAGQRIVKARVHSAHETKLLAGSLARLIVSEDAGDRRSAANQAERKPAKEVLTLAGNLGSGKTTFVQGFCEGLGVAEKVTSPTFTLMHVYHAADTLIYHFDFYRLQSEREVAALGCEDYFGEAISLVEWPELALPFLPQSYLAVRFSMTDFVNEPQTRDIEIERITQHGRVETKKLPNR